MPIFRIFTLISLPFAAGLLSGCATSRQITVDHPQSDASSFEALSGFDNIDGDDYYLQLVSEFDFKGDNALKSGCSDIGPSYEKGAISAALLFHIQNDALRFERDASGFLYEAASGKCNYTFDAKKVYLTPWMRLDSGRDTRVDYSFVSNAESDVNVSKLVGDINAASNVLALTGVGTGIAVMGKLASSYVMAQQPAPGIPGYGNPPTTEVRTETTRSTESHSLPALVSFAGKGGTLNKTRFSVYEVIEGGLQFSPETKPLGELRIYPEITPSLLLKVSADGIPDARDLSLEEIWHSPIKTGSAEPGTLQQFIVRANHSDQPDLDPNWDSYRDMENQCRKLKIVLKELGFNKFDRNAVLYYFLTRNPDWQHYNLAWEQALADEVRPALLEKYRGRNFGNCLSAADYRTMEVMGLDVNTDQDWRAMLQSRHKKESFLGPLKSVERQLVSVINNTTPGEMERQAFPLLATSSGGTGTVLLQNHLGDFGLEKILEIPAVPGDGVVVDATQLSRVFSTLNIDCLSCARPARAQGKPIANIGILLFTTRDKSPLAGGGALEFEFEGGRIKRLSFQHPSFRDYEQDLRDHPEIGGCRVEPDFLGKVQ